MTDGKIRSFMDLRVWQDGHRFVLGVYKMTMTFPREEVYGLTSQMRRAAVSITSNIAEGFGRRSPKEKLQFYNIALGSVTELQNQLLIAKDLGYCQASEYDRLADDLIVVSRLMNGLFTKTRTWVSH